MRDAATGRKGLATRERIVRSAAGLFNRQGYAATPLSDVLAAARIEKGGLYRHFASKAELACAAFEYAAHSVGTQHRARWAQAKTAREGLHAVIDGFRVLHGAPPLEGGCPLFNAAVEVDDGDPLLRDRVNRALSGLTASVAAMVRDGVAAGEFARKTDSQAVASVIVASLEGALVLARVSRDPQHMTRIANHLDAYVESFACDPARRRKRVTH